MNAQRLQRMFSTNFGDSLDGALHCENTFMDTWDDLADASLDPSLFSEVGHVLARLSDDDAGVLCADEGTEGDFVVGRGRGRSGVGRRA